ncbi:23S rRNA (uracil(1939)-C(5))-methyltransferase RlmD [Megasphaera vaginalis (ex Srinivasan et al. 2021)]|uniref:23S rRNA (Uracil-5-)-methyltransferase RumA n=1 Tax=Megasphaera vaginalis (ex Srinivasan et al. 2021) TaxID=1111454 RepID=U7UF99_9FIRM|nr:23S rRNA (uracil(1939)-C(5))-methyltransferase RlmD [Megasphaera vaginalis (ex Srinivasan et al. 2021)]ERT57118.1 23S rRNA (uracil-5-)-methyltransferase RumA [Megasphaera vaginalis (ex Srinivasan et al. 2021)]
MLSKGRRCRPFSMEKKAAYAGGCNTWGKAADDSNYGEDIMAQHATVPVQKGHTYTIEITRLGSSGEGIGRVDGFTAFVPFALPEETVEGEITVVKKQYATAVLKKIVKPSKERVKPPCPVYDRCGGCQLQHLSYPAQLVMKRQQVADALVRIGHLESVPVLPTLGADDPWHYRNKMQFPVAAGARRSLAIGCFAAATHRVINVDECFIQKEGNNRLIPILRQWMKTYKIPAYDEDQETGIVRHLMGRVGVHTGEVMVCLVTACDMVPHLKDLTRMLRESIPNLTGFVQNVNKRHTNVILGAKTKVIYGKPTIRDSIGTLTFNISAQSFFQVNSEQAQRLYEKALEFADLKGQETVVDVYCGTGTITLFLAQRAKQVYGIEIVAPAIKDAVKNAGDNRIANAEFLLGDAAYKLPELLGSGIRPDVIIVDPPRAGCEEKVLTAIARVKPKRIVYVSCNPATLARDLAYMAAKGYKTEKVQPVDMFPMTHHVETVALLSKLNTEHHLDIEIGEDELSEIDFSKDATYGEIKKYVLDKYGLKVSSLYIAQIKRKHGLIERENYNFSKKENQRVPNCPEEKEKAIEDALEHFGMI